MRGASPGARARSRPGGGGKSIALMCSGGSARHRVKMGRKGRKNQRQLHHWIPSGRAKQNCWTNQDERLTYNAGVHREARISALKTEAAAWYVP